MLEKDDVQAQMSALTEELVQDIAVDETASDDNQSAQVEESGESVQDNQIVSADQSYTKTVYGYTVKFTLPGAWVDACTMEADDEYIRFSHTASAADGGLLMLFYFNDIGENDPAFVALGQIDGYEYGYVTPMDVQFSSETQAEYEALFAMIETVAASFTVSGAEGDADMVEEQQVSVNGYLVSFVLPEGWEDVTYEVVDASIVFYHEPSMSAGGRLFTFKFNEAGFFDSAFEMLGQIDNFEYGYVEPMDVQFPENQEDAYVTLMLQIPEVANTFYVR